MARRRFGLTLAATWLPAILACAHFGCAKATRSGSQDRPAAQSTNDTTGNVDQPVAVTPGNDPTQVAGSGTTGTSGASATPPDSSATTGVTPPATASNSGAACLANAMGAYTGKNRLLVGAMMSDDVAAENGWDLRYLYLAGGLSDTMSCQNDSGAWWGCWQDTTLPPGQYLRDFIQKAESKGQLPVVTYYEFLDNSGLGEGTSEVSAGNDVGKLTRYLNDWRFALQQVGQHEALLHIEPDLWGYAEMANGDPSAIPAAVTQANAQDCGGFENSVAGLGKCMVAMARKYAPNAKVGLQASAWATGTDAMQNRDPSVDVTKLAQSTADFLSKAGGSDADFVVMELSDRDAGWYQLQGQNRWFDATNQTLPNFSQAFSWATALTTRLQKPALWWQLPVGNMSLPNTFQQYQDNRVDYLFSHLSDVAKTNAFGMLFGAGLSHQTNPSTDGGNLVAKMKTYASSSGQAVCQ